MEVVCFGGVCFLGSRCAETFPTDVSNKKHPVPVISRPTMSRFFVTTPVFYVNAAPHIGHCYTLVLADALHRLHRLKYPKSKTLFATGTDEHGLKIQKAAAAAKKTESNFCHEVSQKFRNLCSVVNSTHSDFIRTSEERHKACVKHFWNTLSAGGHIYKGTYGGWYSTSDEAFVTDVKEIEIQGRKVTVDAETELPVEWIEEQNYMFALSKFKGDLLHWVDSNPNLVKPKKFQTILRALIDRDLEDLSVSRCSKRVQWAIPVPGDESQSIYVWLDALVNYLSVAGYPNSEFWPPTVQIIGKDILKFHGLFWPAFLIAAGLSPPERLLCHSHWTVDDRKMSKSVGNIVDPFDICQQVTSDGLRYFLLRHSVPHSDSNFSSTKLHQILNSQLADCYGNLLSRCTGKVVNKNQEIPRMPAEETPLSAGGWRLLEHALSLPPKVSHHFEEGDFYLGVDLIHEVLGDANLFVAEAKPWLLAKDPQSSAALDVVLHSVLEVVRISSIMLQPVIPEITERVLNTLDVRQRNWSDAEIHRNDNIALGGTKSLVFAKLKT